MEFKAEVLALGDLGNIREELDGKFVTRPFFKQIQDNYRNISRWTGVVFYEGKSVNLTYEESHKKGGRPYIYVVSPDFELPGDQCDLENARRIAMSKVQAILDMIGRNARWQFGPLEDTEWKPHIGIDSPAALKGVVDKLDVHIKDTAYTSNSDGRSEYETNDFQRAKIYLTLPDRVLELDLSVEGMAEAMVYIIKVLKLQGEAITEIAKVNTVSITQSAQQAINKNTVAAADDQEVAQASVKHPDKYEVMYR